MSAYMQFFCKFNWWTTAISSYSVCKSMCGAYIIVAVLHSSLTILLIDE